MLTKKYKPLEFLTKVLQGTAIGVIVSLIPNAVLSVLLSFDVFKGNELVAMWNMSNVIYQSTFPALTGALIALQFELPALKVAVVAATTYVGSGVTLKSSVLADLLKQLQALENGQGLVKNATALSKGFFTSGTGDVINAMLVASVIVLVLLLLGDRLGSLNIVALPIVGAIVSACGLAVLPHVKVVTSSIGQMIQTFTTYQPYLMSVLIAVSFAVLIVTPISTVAIGLAIGLTGLSAGASAIGVAATTIVLVVNSFRVNKPGVTLAIALGSMKMMMPNVFRHPIILLPATLTAALTALCVPLFNVVGIPSTSGFGLVGFTGFFASINGGLSPVMAVVVWLVVPTTIAVALYFLFTKVLKLYKPEIFKFEA